MSASFQRRVGLSRNQPASPLLKSLPGSRVLTRESLSSRAASIPTTKSTTPTTARMAPKLKVPVAFDAPPLSTDDENESSSGGASEDGAGKRSPDPILDSSEDERPARGDIKATNFQSSNTTRTNANKTNGRKGQSQSQKRTSTRGTGKESPAAAGYQATNPSNKKQRISDDAESLTPGRADHFKDELGFTKMFSSKLKYRYKPREKPKALIDEDTDHQDESKVEDDHDDDHDDSKNYGSKAKAKFRNLPVRDSPKRPAKFILPGNGFSSSPEKKPKRLKMSHLEAADSSDEENKSPPLPPKGRALKRSGSIKRTPKGKSKILVPRKKGAGKKAAGLNPGDLSSLPSSPAKKLVIPTPFSQFEAPKTGLPLVADSDDSDALSDVPSDFSSPSMQELLDLDALIANERTKHAAMTTTASCPWCGACVEKSFLQEFAKGKRLNVRMQSKFCQSHKKQTALETWRERRYPEVSWDELEDRFSKHRELLLGIINGKNSHFRSILATRVELGQVRSLKKEENLNPGYYGPRGFNVMCDYLVGEFGDLLKEKAVTDQVISGRGSAAFIQSVLVPELAVELISEDMRVSADEARNIMEESKVLGEMVHEDA